ncbi:AprI/Inh family metalloprotease inhibitor [Alsobacter sp. R-9]
MRFRTIWTALFVATAAPALAQGTGGGAGGDVPPLVKTLSGVWELANQGGTRSCRLTLTTAGTSTGYQIGMPPACRQALPVLGPASNWSYNADGTISLRDGAGQSVIDLRRDKGGSTFAGRAGTEDLLLTPVSGQPQQPQRRGAKPVQQTPEERAKALSAALAHQPVAEDLPPLQPAQLVGLYGIARDKFRPICSIDLTERPAARRGQYVAVLSGGCLDSGMKIFDPVGWRTERGRLLLVARKGHEQSFAAGKDGIFEKNPPSGQQLYLKKQ